jgi:hypothetical protein
VYGLAHIEGLAKGDPTLSPQLYGVTVDMGDVFIFGLHIGAVGAAIHQVEIFMSTLDTRVTAGGELGAVNEIIRGVASQIELSIVAIRGWADFSSAVFYFEHQACIVMRIHVALSQINLSR